MRTPNPKNPQDIFVLYATKKPAMPCTRQRARLLMERCKAKIFKYNPFTIILLERHDGVNQEVELKFDPGSKTTGIAVVANEKLLFGANLFHRGQTIVDNLLHRNQIRRGRSSRKVRYREARFDNRKNRVGRIPVSLQSRVDNIENWTRKISKICPVSTIAFENVKFDTQKMKDPKISGVQYQQGALIGYQVREYLLEKYQRTCVYCDAKNVPMQIEHVIPKSRGGVDSVNNLVLSCEPCNIKKGSQFINVFVNDKNRLNRIQSSLLASITLKHAAAMNTIRLKTAEMLEKFKIPLSFSDGAETKYNRTNQGYVKDHFIDAACVGNSGAKVKICNSYRPLRITAKGRGNRQMILMDQYGFPRTTKKDGKKVQIQPKKSRRNHEFSNGDLVIANISRGKNFGKFIARVIASNTKRIDIAGKNGTTGTTKKRLILLERFDGYAYSY